MHPDRSDIVSGRLNDISNSLEQLGNKALSRECGLDSDYALHGFLADYHDLLSWMANVKAVIAADDLSKDLDGAEALLKKT